MNDKIRLSMGVFLKVLTKAKYPILEARKRATGKKNNKSDVNLVVALSEMLNAEYHMGAGKDTVSRFINCKMEHSEMFTFCIEDEIRKFDDGIKTSYNVYLEKMRIFVQSFIDSEYEKDKKAISMILRIIENDITIDDETFFYTNEDGTSVTKKELLGMSQICVESFLLGIYHFISTSNIDNSSGEETISFIEKNFDSSSKEIMIYYSGIKEDKIEVEQESNETFDDKVKIEIVEKTKTNEERTVMQNNYFARGSNYIEKVETLNFNFGK